MFSRTYRVSVERISCQKIYILKGQAVINWNRERDIHLG